MLAKNGSTQNLMQTEIFYTTQFLPAKRSMWLLPGLAVFIAQNPSAQNTKSWLGQAKLAHIRFRRKQ